ncbi:hypothetical protein QP994_10950, partial [Corynebacterium sp. MSK044]|nr:hypothetical protein [Corynebacterium sp. MSK044]
PLQYRVRGTPVPTTRTHGTNYPESTKVMKEELPDYQAQILFILGQAKLFGPDAPVAMNELQHYLNRSWNTVREQVVELEDLHYVTAVKKRPLEMKLTPKGLELLGLV